MEINLGFAAAGFIGGVVTVLDVCVLTVLDVCVLRCLMYACCGA